MSAEFRLRFQVGMCILRTRARTSQTCATNPPQNSKREKRGRVKSRLKEESRVSQCGHLLAS